MYIYIEAFFLSFPGSETMLALASDQVRPFDCTMRLTKLERFHTVTFASMSEP